MKTNHVAQAEEYYKLFGEKNAEGIKKYLHADVEFYAPLATLKGKEAVVEAASGFMKMFQSFSMRAKFGAEAQVMIVYDLDIPGISKSFPSASLLSFREELISKIELFFDSSRFLERKKEIFS